MKLKKIAATLLIGSLSLASIVTTVSAQPVSTGTSRANIEFIEPDDAPVVLDPTNPDPENPYNPGPLPEDPEDAPTGETGGLTLDYVSSIYFGEQKITDKAVTYHSTTLRPFIQVSDRRGTGEGWHVMAKMNLFTFEDENGIIDDSLPSAKLELAGGNVKSTVEEGRPTPEGKVELVAGSDSDLVVYAEKDKGLGSWITRWFQPEDLENNPTTNPNVTLEIPATTSRKARKGEHTAEIVWTLTAGPGATVTEPDGQE